VNRHVTEVRISPCYADYDRHIVHWLTMRLYPCATIIWEHGKYFAPREKPLGSGASRAEWLDPSNLNKLKGPR